MWALSKKRDVRWAALMTAAAFAIIGASASICEAKQKSKKVALLALDTPLITNRPFGLNQKRDASAPVRFFTINQVLAKLDSQHDLPSAGRVVFNDLISAPITDVSWRISPPQVALNEPFGLFTFRAPEGLLWSKWRKVEVEIQADMKAIQDCRASPERCHSAWTREFVDIIDNAKGLPTRDKVEAINQSLNASIRYVSDLAQHGVIDRWSPPLATLASKRGDCEDYAIAKYVALREAGIPADDLRLLLVRDRWAGDHAVLGVRFADRWLMLDNRHSILLEPENVGHFTPLFALDHQGVKLFAAPYAKRHPVHHDAVPAGSRNEYGSRTAEYGSGWSDQTESLNPLPY